MPENPPPAHDPWLPVPVWTPAPVPRRPAWPGARVVSVAVDWLALVAVVLLSTRLGMRRLAALVDPMPDLVLLYWWVPLAVVGLGVVLWCAGWLGAQVAWGVTLGGVLTGTRLVDARTGRRPGWRALAFGAAVLTGSGTGALVVWRVLVELPVPGLTVDLVSAGVWTGVAAVVTPVLLVAVPSRGVRRDGWLERATGVRTVSVRRPVSRARR